MHCIQSTSTSVRHFSIILTSNPNFVNVLKALFVHSTVILSFIDVFTFKEVKGMDVYMKNIHLPSNIRDMFRLAQFGRRDPFIDESMENVITEHCCQHLNTTQNESLVSVDMTVWCKQELLCSCSYTKWHFASEMSSSSVRCGLRFKWLRLSHFIRIYFLAAFVCVSSMKLAEETLSFRVFNVLKTKQIHGSDRGQRTHNVCSLRLLSILPEPDFLEVILTHFKSD